MVALLLCMLIGVSDGSGARALFSGSNAALPRPADHFASTTNPNRPDVLDGSVQGDLFVHLRPTLSLDLR